jgi:citrate lyase subunit beta/citryl-CoA lyase
MRAPRLRRSVLYVPGSNARALDKSAGLDADVLVYDLEDAVAPSAKVAAREAIAAALARGGHRALERVVRINGLDTPWGADDLAWAAEQAVDGVMLPKVESATTVRRAEARLPASVSLWCLIETPRGVLAVEALAASSPRLTALVMGTSDLTKDLRARVVPSRAPLAYALGRVVMAARAFDLDAIDGVHLALDDEAGFLASAADSVALGFDGRTLIHPRTIALAHQVYGPTPAEVSEARAVIEAFGRAAARGEALVVHQGRLVEALHVAAAERIVALATALSSRGEPAP